MAAAFVLFIVGPAILLVFLRTHAARTGYEILALRQEIELLQSDNARLLATAVSLRSLDRVERIATTVLDMAPPRHQQVASLTITPPSAQAVPRVYLWQRVRGWLVGQAEAKTR